MNTGCRVHFQSAVRNISSARICACTYVAARCKLYGARLRQSADRPPRSGSAAPGKARRAS
eukprot:13933416-Alexandrium_andersonii.AAC.1